MKERFRKTTASLALLILSIIHACGQSGPAANPATNQKPVAVPSEEVEAHRVGRPPILRVDLNPRVDSQLALVGVVVEVTVNPDGEVTSAHTDVQDFYQGIPSSLGSQVETLVSKMRYRPFERDGHPVWATFEERVFVLPPEIKPLWHTRFPEIGDWNSLVITFTRTGCFGFCPSYRVEVHADGTFLYDGKSSVAIRGTHRCAIPQENVRRLVTEFRNADYFSLRDEYVCGATDFPTYISSIKFDGHSKQVKDYVGLVIGMPMAVDDLEESIDGLSEVGRWTKGDADTVGCLQAEKWDFKSAEAANALAAVAEKGTIDALRDLVAAGVPLNGRDERGETALSEAAYRGNVEMLHILLVAGAGKKDPQEIGEAFEAACRSRNSEAMRLLLGAGVPARFVDTRGRTTLMSAAASGVPSIVEEVLRKHPDANAHDSDGVTALMEAVDQYERDDAGFSEINRAQVVQILLRAGADPNARDNNGTTALIDATWEADAALALIRAGANVNAQDKYGITALINCDSPEVARVLLANGADPSIRDSQGKTALDHAREGHKKEMVAVLSGEKP